MKCVLFSYLCGIAAEKGEVRVFVNSQTSLSIAGDFTKNIYILFFCACEVSGKTSPLVYGRGASSLHFYFVFLTKNGDISVLYFLAWWPSFTQTPPIVESFFRVEKRCFRVEKRCFLWNCPPKVWHTGRLQRIQGSALVTKREKNVKNKEGRWFCWKTWHYDIENCVRCECGSEWSRLHNVPPPPAAASPHCDVMGEKSYFCTRKVAILQGRA